MFYVCELFSTFFLKLVYEYILSETELNTNSWFQQIELVAPSTITAHQVYDAYFRFR